MVLCTMMLRGSIAPRQGSTLVGIARARVHTIRQVMGHQQRPPLQYKRRRRRWRMMVAAMVGVYTIEEP